MFTYKGGNKAKAGFFDAIALVMETGFAVTAFLAVALNLLLPEEDESEEIESLAGDLEDERKNEEAEVGGTHWNGKDGENGDVRPSGSTSGNAELSKA